MWQLVLEAGSPATLSVLLFAMRYAFESVRRGLTRRRTSPESPLTSPISGSLPTPYRPLTGPLPAPYRPLIGPLPAPYRTPHRPSHRPVHPLGVARPRRDGRQPRAAALTAAVAAAQAAAPRPNPNP